MTLAKAKILKAPGNAATLDASPLTAEPRTLPRRVAHVELAARERAAEILAAAEAEAASILDAARVAAESAHQTAALEARENEIAKLAAHWTALKLEEDTRLSRETGRLVQLAVLLAERLIVGELTTDPERIRALADSAIGAARGASSVTLEAHPDDAEPLRRLLCELRSTAALTVRESNELSRGSLLVHTELGTLDARLRPQLERLAAHLTALLRA